MSRQWPLAGDGRPATPPPPPVPGDPCLRSPGLEDVRSLREFLIDHGRMGPRYSTPAIIEQLKRGSDLIRMAESPRQGLQGVAWGSYDHRRGWIHDVVVDDHRGGGGLKQILVAEVEARLAAQGCCRINWFVAPRSGEVSIANSMGYRWPPPLLLLERHLPEGPGSGVDEPLPALRLRSYREADREALLALWNRAGLAISAGDSASGLRHKMTRDPELFLVATTGDGTIVASLLGSNDFPDGWISHLAVEASWRRRGVGAHLITTATARMRVLGCSAVRLWVRPEREAVGFYHRLGFVNTPFLAVRKDLGAIQ